MIQNDLHNFFTTGGGISSYYPTPSYQKKQFDAYFQSVKSTTHAPVSEYGISGKGLGRGYPDVVLGGKHHVACLQKETIYLTGGTSASAPTFAGFISNINAARFCIGKGQH